MDFEKLKKLIPIVEREKGKVHFLAAFERTRLPGEWDIVLAADGLLPGQLQSIGYVIDQLKPLVGGEKGMLKIAKVVILDKDEYFVNEVREMLEWGGSKRFRNEVIGEVSVNRGYILKAPSKRRGRSQTA